MMSNINKADDVIDDYLQRHILTGGTGNPLHLARALADAGLIAPDLPEPDKDHAFAVLGPTWEVRKEHGGVFIVTSRQGSVRTPGSEHPPPRPAPWPSHFSPPPTTQKRTTPMSDPRTTAEWAALLDGAADGPWEVVRHDEPGISIRTIVHDPGRYVGDIYGEDNARLIAAAPEAVAEVVRLRRRLAAQGLLADDLPEPSFYAHENQNKPMWDTDNHFRTDALDAPQVALSKAGNVWKMPPAEARALALALLAAADHAEKEKQQ